MQRADPTPRPRWIWQVAIFAFLAFHGALSLRSAWLEDDRWGWRMFHHVAFCNFSYEWVMKDGSVQEYKPGQELIRAGKSYLRPGHRRAMWFATGSARSMVDAYLEWLWTHRRPEDAVAIRARMSYTINDQRDPHVELSSFPEGES
jgi:hypothetical protein